MKLLHESLKYIFILIIIFVGLKFLSYKSEQKRDRYNFFVQAIPESNVIKNLQEKVSPIISEMIEKELGIKQDKNFPIFFPKKRQAVTIYYINDLHTNNDLMARLMYLFIEPDLKKVFKNSDVFLKKEVEFFGQQTESIFSALDLVVLIDDQGEQLYSLNKEAKKYILGSSNRYKNFYNNNLYDIEKSEEYSYIPHICIGHLRLNYIKYLIKNSQKNSLRSIDRIKKGVLEIVSKELSNVSLDDRKLNFNKFAIYDHKNKKYIKEIFV